MSDPLHVQAAQFLVAARDDDTTEALALLDAYPGLVQHDLACACAAGDVAAVAVRLAADASSAQRTTAPDDMPPLVYAVLTGVKRARGVSDADHVSIGRMLLDAGADPNTRFPLPDAAGRIPVLYFLEAGNVAAARLLLERGAAPSDGESLYHAAQHDRRDVLELLRAAGADLSRGRTQARPRRSTFSRRILRRTRSAPRRCAACSGCSSTARIQTCRSSR